MGDYPGQGRAFYLLLFTVLLFLNPTAAMQRSIDQYLPPSSQNTYNRGYPSNSGPPEARYIPTGGGGSGSYNYGKPAGPPPAPYNSNGPRHTSYSSGGPSHPPYHSNGPPQAPYQSNGPPPAPYNSNARPPTSYNSNGPPQPSYKPNTPTPYPRQSTGPSQAPTRYNAPSGPSYNSGPPRTRGFPDRSSSSSYYGGSSQGGYQHNSGYGYQSGYPGGYDRGYPASSQQRGYPSGGNYRSGGPGYYNQPPSYNGRGYDIMAPNSGGYGHPHSHHNHHQWGSSQQQQQAFVTQPPTSTTTTTTTTTLPPTTIAAGEVEAPEYEGVPTTPVSTSTTSTTTTTTTTTQQPANVNNWSYNDSPFGQGWNRGPPSNSYGYNSYQQSGPPPAQPSTSYSSGHTDTRWYDSYGQSPNMNTYPQYSNLRIDSIQAPPAPRGYPDAYVPSNSYQFNSPVDPIHTQSQGSLYDPHQSQSTGGFSFNSWTSSRSYQEPYEYRPAYNNPGWNNYYDAHISTTTTTTTTTPTTTTTTAIPTTVFMGEYEQPEVEIEFPPRRKTTKTTTTTTTTTTPQHYYNGGWQQASQAQSAQTWSRSHYPNPPSYSYGSSGYSGSSYSNSGPRGYPDSSNTGPSYRPSYSNTYEQAPRQSYGSPSHGSSSHYGSSQSHGPPSYRSPGTSSYGSASQYAPPSNTAPRYDSSPSYYNGRPSYQAPSGSNSPYKPSYGTDYRSSSSHYNSQSSQYGQAPSPNYGSGPSYSYGGSSSYRTSAPSYYQRPSQPPAQPQSHPYTRPQRSPEPPAPINKPVPSTDAFSLAQQLSQAQKSTYGSLAAETPVSAPSPSPAPAPAPASAPAQAPKPAAAAPLSSPVPQPSHHIKTPSPALNPNTGGVEVSFASPENFLPKSTTSMNKSPQPQQQPQPQLQPQPVQTPDSKPLILGQRVPTPIQAQPVEPKQGHRFTASDNTPSPQSYVVYRGKRSVKQAFNPIRKYAHNGLPNIDTTIETFAPGDTPAVPQVESLTADTPAYRLDTKQSQNDWREPVPKTVDYFRRGEVLNSRLYPQQWENEAAINYVPSNSPVLGAVDMSVSDRERWKQSTTFDNTHGIAASRVSSVPLKRFGNPFQLFIQENVKQDRNSWSLNSNAGLPVA